MPLQPQILTDGFGRIHSYLRISLTERCNLRCRYCMPADGVPLQPRDQLLTFEEVERVARLFVAEGVDKIRLTGGEPLLRKDVEDLMDMLGRIEGLRTLAVTTNGLLLRKKLDRMRLAGVNQLNISLDSLREDRFEFITRRAGLGIVLDAIDLAIDAGYNHVKVNCVVMRGFNDDELGDFVEFTRDRPVDIRFIEYMPFEGNGWNDSAFVPYTEMLSSVSATHPQLSRLPDSAHDTSKAYAVPGYMGRVGFITSMSEHFCSSCNRLRVTADGSLKVCLFGNAEVSLRDQMRSGATDETLRALIAGAVFRKSAAHGGMYAIASSENRPMILIGG
jgi:cyclic pyranopterin phosphate synthase